MGFNVSNDGADGVNEVIQLDALESNLRFANCPSGIFVHEVQSDYPAEV